MALFSGLRDTNTFSDAKKLPDLRIHSLFSSNVLGWPVQQFVGFS